MAAKSIALVVFNRDEDSNEEMDITECNSIDTLKVLVEDTFDKGSISHLQIWSERFNKYKKLTSFEEVQDGCQINAVPKRTQDQPTPVVSLGMTKEPLVSPTLTYCTESLGKNKAKASSDANQAGASAYAQNSNIWTEKDVLNVHFLNPEILDQENWKCEYGVLNTTNILSWAAAWNTKKCPNIPIIKKTGRPESADIRVKFEEGDRSHSEVGSQATKVVDKSKPTMVLSLNGKVPNEQKFLVMHEFGHALGLFHEHQRSDFWKVANSLLDVEKMKKDSRMKNVNFGIDILQMESEGPTTISPYDPDSIMHYWFDVNWLKKKDHKTLLKVEADRCLSEEAKTVLRGIHKRHRSCADGPSEKDLDFLQKIYGGVSPASPTPNNSSVPQRAVPSYGQIQLSPSDKPYLNALYDAAYSGREMWSNIGNNLGLSGDDLSAIRTNNPLDVGGCFRAMLLKWFQSGSNCYLETFLSALESKTVGLGNLCSDVEGAILKIANGPQVAKRARR